MAKIFTFIWFICIIFSCTYNNVQDVLLEEDSVITSDPIVIIPEEVLIDTIIIEDTPIIEIDTIIIETFPSIPEVYNKYLGVREKTGKNDGPEVKYFLSTVGLPEGYAWCAAYVKAVLLESGIKSATVINGMALSCENKLNLVYQKHKFVKDLKQGDVFTIYYTKLKRIGHTGFVDIKINNNIYETNEGNTNEQGSREGDGVYKKRRSFNTTHSISRWE